MASGPFCSQEGERSIYFRGKMLQYAGAGNHLWEVSLNSPMPQMTKSAEGNPANEGEFVFHTPEPVLVLPLAQDFSILGQELFNETLRLSNRVTNLGNALDSLDLSSPGFDRFFERRQEGYAVLAATAMDLIERLLADFDLNLPEKPDYYRQREGLASVVQAAGQGGTGTRKAAVRVQTPGSNITHLFPKTGEEGE